MQPKAINGNSLSVSLKMKQPYKSIGLSHIFSTKPACSLWFPIASHTGKTITNFILNNYIYKLSNLAARFNTAINASFLFFPLATNRSYSCLQARLFSFAFSAHIYSVCLSSSPPCLQILLFPFILDPL